MSAAAPQAPPTSTAPQAPGATGTSTPPRPRVVVLGGGVAGLAAAHRLAPRCEVVLLEASDQLGGLGTFADVDGSVVERFYHCVMPTDTDLLLLLDAVGVAEGIAWRPTTMGMVVDGRRYPFNTALDLLRFRPLTLLQRLRLGVVTLLLRRLGQGRDLDRVRAGDWLPKLYGTAVWRAVWEPLFRAKFGDRVADVPALYLWERLGREKNVAVRGYPAGGYRAVVGALRRGVEARGAQVRLRAPARSLRETRPGGPLEVELADGEVLTADWVLSTVPVPLLGRLVAGDEHLRALVPGNDLPHTGVVNALFFLRRRVDGHYWTPVIRSGTDFNGVVQMSELAGTEHTGGRHLVYAMKYCEASSALFAEDDAAIAARWTDQLLALYPDLLGRDDVLDVRVFRAPHVEPAYPLGYATSKPGAELPGTRLLLATTAQVYPRVTAWNSSAGLAAEVADLLLERSDAEVPG